MLQAKGNQSGEERGAIVTTRGCGVQTQAWDRRLRCVHSGDMRTWRDETGNENKCNNEKRTRIDGVRRNEDETKCKCNNGKRSMVAGNRRES